MKPSVEQPHRDREQCSMPSQRTTVTGGAIAGIPKKTYIPIGCLVALHIYEPEERPSGLVVPTDRDGMNLYETTRCKVIAVGADCKWVKEGDEVLCCGSAFMVIHKGQKTAITREDQLAGVVIE